VNGAAVVSNAVMHLVW